MAHGQEVFLTRIRMGVKDVSGGWLYQRGHGGCGEIRTGMQGAKGKRSFNSITWTGKRKLA